MAATDAAVLQERIERCRQMSRTLKRWVVEQSLASNVGHISSALSIADMMAALWGGVMHKPGIMEEDRDRFILSKGHAALTLYAAMRWSGIIDEPTFQTYCGDGSFLGVHPDTVLSGIDLSTGSLGQGLSVACGVAYGLRKHGRPSHVYVLLSDAECNEGQVWEAAMFAAQHRLTNITTLLDLNGVQAFGRTCDILDLHQTAIWSAFGWEVVEIDGHDIAALLQALDSAPGKKPRILIARTVTGRGVSFMEHQVDWHYKNISADEAALALEELEAAD